MMFSELEELMSDYRSAMYSPSRSEVHLGCDCGCGGDSYTSESWDSEQKRADEAIEAMKDFCETHGIAYDGME